MADTDLVPDDGMTAGSGTTPRTIPAVRQGAAAARDLLVGLAAKQWGADARGLSVKDGKVVDADGKRELSYADLAASDDAAKAFGGPVPGGVTLTAVQDWKVARHVRPAPQRPGPRHRRAPLPVRHPPARHALRQGPAAADVRGEAERRSTSGRRRR